MQNQTRDETCTRFSKIKLIVVSVFQTLAKHSAMLRTVGKCERIGIQIDIGFPSLFQSAEKDFIRKDVFDLDLHQPRQWSGAILRVMAVLGQPMPCFRGQRHKNLFGTSIRVRDSVAEILCGKHFLSFYRRTSAQSESYG